MKMTPWGRRAILGTMITAAMVCVLGGCATPRKGARAQPYAYRVFRVEADGGGKTRLELRLEGTRAPDSVTEAFQRHRFLRWLEVGRESENLALGEWESQWKAPDAADGHGETATLALRPVSHVAELWICSIRRIPVPITGAEGGGTALAMKTDVVLRAKGMWHPVGLDSGVLSLAMERAP